MVESATVARLDQLAGLAERIERKKADLDETRGDLGQIYSQAEEDGFHRRALKEAIRLRGMEPSKRNDYLHALQAYCDELGVWSQGDMLDPPPEIPEPPAGRRRRSAPKPTLVPAA
jgi:uncharacterized protein (UPF0335 family)